ncbi:MAG: 4Fe-4S dicluster domain-containing protein [Armatimonadota bacterium]
MAEAPVVDNAELSEVFLSELLATPAGEKVKTCIQCGTCSASCPTSYAMDHTPRQVISFFRAGMLREALCTNTVWMCASCYSCTVRCPAGIKLTDIMYELKRLGTKYGLTPPDETLPVLSTAFVDSVEKYGRNFETGMMTQYTMRTGPLGGLKNLPLGLLMKRLGRLKLRPDSIEGVEDLRKMVDVLKKKREAE